MKKRIMLGQLCVGLILFGCNKEHAPASQESQQAALGSQVNFQNALPASPTIVLSTVFHGLTITFHQNFAIGYPNSGRGTYNQYDYSADLMLDGTTYRLFHGGDFEDLKSDGSRLSQGDAIFERKCVDTQAGTIANWNTAAAYVEPTLNPVSSVHPAALWRQGEDVGLDPHIWDSGNYMDPECIKVGSTYYMYSQVEIHPGDFIDQPATETANPSAADRVNLHTSNNGESNWVKTFPGGVNRGVIINLPSATRRQTKLINHEMMYEAGTAKPWVMYVDWQNNYVEQGYVRIRSNTPDTFDWNDREACHGMSQLGNKVGYADVPKTGGGTTRLYFRITFNEDPATSLLVPSFQFSTNGLTFEWGTDTNGVQNLIKLAGPAGKNCKFLGMSTINGTGELQSLGSNNYNMIYGASAEVGSDRLSFDIWLGKTQMQLTGSLTP